MLRAQVEISQVRQEIDRRLGEKEEEFEHARKNHLRAMDSMQASLEAEARAKDEALRIKKKLESDINEMEIALDHANKAHAEAKKAIKRSQGNLAEVNQVRVLTNVRKYIWQIIPFHKAISDERKATGEVREALGLTERKANAGAGELEESKALLEAAIRAQRQVEAELQETRENLSGVEQENVALVNTKRRLEGDVSQMRADGDNVLAGVRNSEEKARKAQVDAGRLADELRVEQEHASGLERAVKSGER